MAGLMMRSRCFLVRGEGRQLYLWWTSYRGMSAYDDGRMFRDEERSQEAVYMRKREAELLEKLRKQDKKLEELKEGIAEYKENQDSIKSWLNETKTDKPPQT